MSGIFNDEPNIVLLGERNTLSDVCGFRGVDRVHRLVADCTVLGWRLARCDIDDRAGLRRVGETDGIASLKSLVRPLGIDVRARCIVLKGTGIARGCWLDVLDELSGYGAVQCVPFSIRRPARIGGRLVHLSGVVGW